MDIGYLISPNPRGKALGILILLAALNACHCTVNLYALFNMDGINGTVNFVQDQPGANITIIAHLDSWNEPANFSWHIATNLISYADRDRCNRRLVGSKLTDLTSVHGHLSVPTNGEVVLQHNGSNGGLTLHGASTIWEKSLILEGVGGGPIACANILSLDHVRVSEAKFTSGVAGSVTFRQSFDNATSIVPSTIITVDLFHVGSDAPASSSHDWRIMVTDILDSKRSRRIGTCDHLTTLFDPDNVADEECSATQQRRCKKGDLVSRHGQILVGAQRSRFTRKTVFDVDLPLPADLEGSRHLYVALYGADDPNVIHSCAKIREVRSKESQVRLLADGTRGLISIRQQSPLDPAHVTVNLSNPRGVGVFYHVHVFPVPPRVHATDSATTCTLAGDHFNPYGINRALSPAPGNFTYDKYEVGDLSGKYGLLTEGEYTAEFIDPYVTLYGVNSVAGRSVVVHRQDSSRWICANVEYPQPVATAVATFFYPFSGRVIFRQDAADPLDDTTVFIESLIFNDGTRNFSAEHRWAVHSLQVSNDSLDWQKRCRGAGDQFNPYSVSTADVDYRNCRSDAPQRCTVGDFTSKFGRVSVTAASDQVNLTRAFYTDVSLPLTGQSGIIGRSLVVMNDRALEFLGNRMSCASIYRRWPSRGRVQEWHASGAPSDVTGRVILEQAFDYDLTTSDIEVRGLNRTASGYHVHEVPVPVEMHFPCAADAVYGHYNPFKVEPKLSPPPGFGSSDQYELGDLSGKYGTLENEDSVYVEAVDSNLPVQGHNSVLGRSIVIHKKERGDRWLCGNVEPFIKDDGKRVQAVASFHHPKGFAYGYIKLGQVEYSDGSLSDTTIEVNLRHVGQHNKNITNGHRWGVFVNQVGADRAVDTYLARCISAGYQWNPYRVKSDRDDYEKECNTRNPYGCEMGDVTGRQGPIDIGGLRKIFTDTNLPLAGNYSVMKRSIVIQEKNGAHQRFACANIEPDHDIVQKVQIKKLNRLSSTSFINKVREEMAVPDWLMHLDDGETKDLGNCLQFTVWFRGPDASKIQLDFDDLLLTGKVVKLYAVAAGDVPKKKKQKFPYKSCSAYDPDYPNGGHQLNGHIFGVTWTMMIILVLTTQVWW